MISMSKWRKGSVHLLLTKMTPRITANQNPKKMISTQRGLLVLQSTHSLVEMREGVGVGGINLLQGSRSLRSNASLEYCPLSLPAHPASNAKRVRCLPIDQ